MAKQDALTGDASADDWVLAFIADVESGHAGRTMAMVGAIRDGKSTSDASRRLGVDELERDLDREKSAAARNRVLRRWLSSRKLDVIAHWHSIGFPQSPNLVHEARAEKPIVFQRPVPRSLATPSDRSTSSRCEGHVTGGPCTFEEEERCCDAGTNTGIIVFDFDQTLTTKHVGVFEDMDQIVDRAFGGAERLAMLCSMLTLITSRGIAITVVSRNSRHVVRKALQYAGLFRYVSDGFIFGFEDYEDDVPKSCVVRSRIVPALGPLEEVLFVDDDPSNLTDMRTHCPEATLMLAPRTGLGQDECNKIISWVDRFSQADSVVDEKLPCVRR